MMYHAAVQYDARVYAFNSYFTIITTMKVISSLTACFIGKYMLHYCDSILLLYCCVHFLT